MNSEDVYRLVKINYDNVDIDFHNSYRSQEEFPDQMAEIAKLGARGKVLVVGGTLSECEYFLDQGLQVTNIDISQTILDDIGRNPEVEVALSSILDYKSDQPFDCAWVCRSLFHIPSQDIDEALCSLRALLRPGGAAGIVMFTAPGNKIVEQQIKDGNSTANGQPTTYYRVLYPRKTFEDKVEPADFTIQKSQITHDKDDDEALSLLAIS